MKILFIGDVFGRPGRRVVTALLPGLREETGAALVIANGENAAGGAGITAETAQDLFQAGVDVVTGGNHIWDKDEALAMFDRDPRFVRPLNYPPGTPGKGIGVFDVGEHRVAVISALGRIFLPAFDCPFRGIDGALESLDPNVRIILVDMHAEATAEKVAMGWYLDGRVSAVLGTHTHVQTADERILPRGTACLTDAGMTGPHDSIIGVRKELALRRLLSMRPVRYQPADADLRLHGALVEVDPTNGHALSIERIARRLEAKEK